MKKIVCTARTGDWHAAIKGRKGIWGCGPTPEIAARECWRTALSLDVPDEGYEIEYANDPDTMGALACPSKNVTNDPEEIRARQEIRLMAAYVVHGRRLF